MKVGKVYIHKVSNELFDELSSHYAMSTKSVKWEAVLDYNNQNDLLQYITHFEFKCYKEMRKLIKLLNRALDKYIFMVYIYTDPKD